MTRRLEVERFPRNLKIIQTKARLHYSAKKADLEARPHAALAVDSNIAALSVKDGFGERQPDANAVLTRVRAAVKAVEDVGQVRTEDAFAIIADNDFSVQDIRTEADLDLAPFRGMLYAVLDYVGQRLGAPVKVAHKACPFGATDHEALLLDLQWNSQRFQRPVNQSAHIHHSLLKAAVPASSRASLSNAATSHW